MNLRRRAKNRIESYWKRMTSPEDLSTCFIFVLLAMIFPFLVIVVAAIYLPRFLAFCMAVLIGTYAYLAFAGILNNNALNALAFKSAELYFRLAVPVVIIAIFNTLTCAMKPMMSQLERHFTKPDA